MEKWAGQRLEEEGIVFGIRRYIRGAWMSLHVDRLPTHIFGVILQVINSYKSYKEC